MADVNANIGVNIDASDALAQLKSLQRQIAQFHSAVSRSSEAAALAQRDLQKNFINGVNSIGAFSAELRTVKTSAESFTTSLEKNKFSMREYFRYAGGATKTFGKLFRSEFDTVQKVAVENVKRLQTQYIKMGRDASGAMKAIAIMPTELDMTNLSTKTQLAAQRQAIFNQLVKQGSTNLLNFGKNTQWAGRQLMVGFTLPLMTLGSVATRTFMEMETAAIKFKKVYGDLFTNQQETQFALESIQSLGKEFTKYGIAVADTVSLAADAAAAGFSGTALEAQVKQATRLQVLGQVDQQKALETTISLQNAFKISSNELADSINFLNAVENQTVVSLDDITTAIPKAAPIVKELGGDIKDLAFFMAAMKEGGINASEGANALKSGLASMINPSKKAKGMLLDMGIDIDNIVEKNVGNLKATVIEFGKALDGLSGLQRQRAIEQLFGKFQQARLSALFDNVIKDGNQAARVLDLASSSMEDLAALAEKELGITADSAMNKFRASIENLKVSLVPVGKAFLEVITPLLDKLNSMLNWFNGLSDSTKKVVTKVVLYLGAIAPVLLMTIGLMANFIANGIKGLMLLRTGFLRLSGQSQVLGEQTQYLTSEQLDAAAAAHSLEQSHARLTQAFTVEAGAVAALRKEYQLALGAASRFAMTNPGMMVTPKRIRKYAKGVVSVPGPKGAGDIIPAMLSPGESVIPADMTKKYAPLINGMIANNIPGFKKGLYGETPIGPSGKLAEYGHIGIRVEQTIDEFLKEILALPELLRKKRQTDIDRLSGLQEVGLGSAKVGTYSRLATWQSHELNQAIGKGESQVPIKMFAKDFEHFGTDMWIPALKDGGSSLQEVANELPAYHKALKDRVIKFGEENKTSTITGKQYAALEAELRKTLPSTSKLRIALDRAALMVDEYRVNISAEEADFVRRNYPERVVGTGTHESITTYGEGGKEAGYKSKVRIKGDRFFKKDIFGRRSRYEANLQANALGDDTVKSVAVGAGTASPSRKTIPVGADIANGLIVGMESRTGAVAQSGKKVADAAVNAVKAGRKKTRRVARRGQGPAPIGVLAPAGATMLPIVAPLTEKEKRTEKRRAVRGKVARGVKGVGTKVAGAGGGFGASGLLFALSMLPGKFGQLAQSIMPAVFGLQALGMVTKIIGVWPTLLLAVGAGLYALNKSAINAANALTESAKKEAEARYGSIEATQQYADFTGRELASQREFSRNNRQIISASGEAVQRFADFYGQKDNRSLQVINQAALKGPQAGVNAAAVDVAQRAAIFGLSPADIAANIKAASDLIGADQVKLKAKIQELLAPNGKDITKEPLTIEARMEFLKKDSETKIKSITESISKIADIKIPKSATNFLSGSFGVKGETSYQTLKKAAGLQESINKSYSGGIGGNIMGAAKQAGRFVSGYYDQAGLINFDALGKYKELQGSIQGATVQLSVAFMDQKEALGLLNAQYADGLITKEQYDAAFAVSSENFDTLAKAGMDLVTQLTEMDSSGELAAGALEDLGNQALGALKKSNPELFKKLAKNLKAVDDNAEIQIYMGYAKGSLTIMDLAIMPDLLKKINGMEATAALNFILSSNLSEGGKAIADAIVAINELAKISASIGSGGITPALAAAQAKWTKKLDDAQARADKAAKVKPTGNLDTDAGGGKTAGSGSGKDLSFYDKELAMLNKKRDALKEVNDELDRQNQYQQKQMDLISQAAKAKITGNYIQAAMLGQQSMNLAGQYARESQIQQMDKVISITESAKQAADKRKKLLPQDKSLIKNITSGNYGAISPRAKTPDVNLGYPGAGSTVYNVNMNVNGVNDPQKAADIVIRKLTIMDKKTNKGNRVAV